MYGLVRPNLELESTLASSTLVGKTLVKVRQKHKCHGMRRRQPHLIRWVPSI